MRLLGYSGKLTTLKPVIEEQAQVTCSELGMSITFSFYSSVGMAIAARRGLCPGRLLVSPL
jgi:hypothetical protein